MRAEPVASGAPALPEVESPPARAGARRRLPLVPLALIAVFVLGALLAPWLSPADPQEQSLRNKFRPPVWEEGGSWQRPLGTDRLVVSWIEPR